MRIPRALTMSAAVSLAAVAVGLPSAAAAPSPTTGSDRLATATARAVASTVVLPAPPKRPRHRGTKAIVPTRRTKLTAGSGTAPMTYHGGRLMTAPTRVYLVW